MSFKHQKHHQRPINSAPTLPDLLELPFTAFYGKLSSTFLMPSFRTKKRTGVNKCPYCYNGFATMPGLSRHLAHDATCQAQLRRTLKISTSRPVKSRLSPDLNLTTRSNGDSPSPSNRMDETFGFDTFELEEGATPRSDMNDEGIRNRLHVERYPGNAGSTFGSCQIDFNRKNDIIHDLNTNHVLNSQDTWGLAKWLMINNLSGASRDDYFKLSIVSSVCSQRNFDHNLHTLEFASTLVQ